MTQFLIDATLPEKLTMTKQPVELCDDSGRVLGQFIPRLDPVEYDLEPQISEEEIDRRLSNITKLYSTAEVLALLKGQ